MKLYPPVIEGVLPAFCGSVIQIPFTMNKSVSKDEISGFALKIKTVQNQNDVWQTAIISEVWNEDANIVTFNLEKYMNEGLKLNIGQFYKLQLAYIYSDKTTIGYYSTVGVAKYTSEPELSINSKDGYTYLGIYNQESDLLEKLYSYCFTLFEKVGNSEKIIETSGEQLHNSSKDTKQGESINTYIIKSELEKNKIYRLEYKIKTINNLEKTIKTDSIIKASSVDSTLKADVVCDIDLEEGCVDIKLETKIGEPSVGRYYLLRASDEDNFNSWNEILSFELYGQQASKYLWKDMSVKHGVKYKYAVQQYNSYNLRSNKIESNIIRVDFEHAYLYDGERQLKIKYNPKVSSFKTTLMETKIDTIGSKYPFIFKNGNVGYKEFPISGLISFLSDENRLFDIESNTSYSDKESFQTDLTINNIYAEREFKLKVLNWLNNGQPKLFKSPTEGNYIVRIMNVSLSPTDQLGRMLHTFNCTAYEIAENNYENLEKFNFIKINNPSKTQLRWLSKNLKAGEVKENENLLDHIASSIRLEGLIPGDKIEIITEEGNNIQNYSIVIGVTGSYILDLNNDVKIKSLIFKSGSSMGESIQHQGMLTYSYYTSASEFKDSFDIINKIESLSVPCRQFIGAHDDIIAEINNVKEVIESIGYMKFYLRNADKAIYQDQNGQYYSDPNLSNPFDITELTDIYQLFRRKNNKGEWVSDDEWLDGYNNKIYQYYDRYRASIFINGSRQDINLEDVYQYYVKNPENIKSIKIGAGVIAELCYQKKVVTYDVEKENQSVNEAKLLKELAESQLLEAINSSVKRSKLKEMQDKYIACCKYYNEKLEEAIAEAERR